MRMLLCLPILLATILPARAASPPPAPASSPAALCEAAILGAEHAGKTPKGMLAAISLVESGRPDPANGIVHPWPWTIDANGVGQFFATKAEAIAAVMQLQAQGVRSIDIGCMQINLLHHPDAFATLDQAFDPAANAAYAVRFLKALYAQTNDWPRSVAAYHSNTPQLADDYQRRVLAIWQGAPLPRVIDTGIVLNGSLFTRPGESGRVYGLILPTPVAIGGFPAPQR
jgi:hypothetical protein